MYTVDLDRQSHQIILDSLRAAVRRSRWATLVSDLRADADRISLAEFLERHDHRLEDVYKSGRSWTILRRDAGRTSAAPSDAKFERDALRAVSRLTHVDDPERIDFFRTILSESTPPGLSAIGERGRRLLTMLAWDLGSGAAAYSSLDDYYQVLWRESALRSELIELLDVLDSRSTTRTRPSGLAPEVPLILHARYSRVDALAALGTQPFTFLGPVSYVDHRGERPVQFTWRLPEPMPEDLFEVARSVAAA